VLRSPGEGKGVVEPAPIAGLPSSGWAPQSGTEQRARERPVDTGLDAHAPRTGQLIRSPEPQEQRPIIVFRATDRRQEVEGLPGGRVRELRLRPGMEPHKAR
jgi:hypothetical protein